MKIKKLNENRFKVESSKKGEFYTVDLNAPSCTCAHFSFRLKGTGEKCKHIAAVEEKYGRTGKKEKPSQKSLLSYSRIIDEVKRKKEAETVVLMEKYGTDEVQRLIETGELIEKKGKVKVLE
ncbi:SWIM zinc finger family protein [Candidatus Woesearchaeota archaeon]|nr:SWIM zinc finger family protein [Candidatus Woesearchaeota archaeon]